MFSRRNVFVELGLIGIVDVGHSRVLVGLNLRRLGIASLINRVVLGVALRHLLGNSFTESEEVGEEGEHDFEHGELVTVQDVEGAAAGGGVTGGHGITGSATAVPPVAVLSPFDTAIKKIV